MSREKNLVKNTVIIGFGTMLPKVANIITLPIITMWLTKTEYGTYDLISTLVSLLLPVITLQIQSAAFRFLIDTKQDRNRRQQIISTITVFSCSLTLVSVAVLYFVLYRMENTIRILICLYFFADITLILLQQIARGLSKNGLYSVSTIVVSFINMLLVVVTLQFFHTGLAGVLFSVAAATLLAAALLFVKLHLAQYISFHAVSLPVLKELLDYSWPMIPNSLSNWAMNLSDRLVITGFLGLEANAVFSVASKIPNLFTSVQGTFVMAWQESASLSSEDKDSETYYSNTFDAVLRILFGIMACLIAFSPLLFRLLIRGEYSQAYPQMPILYVAMFFSALASFMGGIYVALKKTKSIGITTVCAAAVNLTVDLLLVRKIGIYAGSISTLVSFFLLFCFRVYDIQKYIHFRTNKKLLVELLSILTVFSVLNWMQNPVIDVVNGVLAIGASVLFNRDVIKVIFRQFSRRLGRK